MWTCYLLRSCKHGSPATYVGITVNVKRRLRQHNGCISGGAKYTASRRPWKYVLHVGPFKSHREALQFEYRWKHAAPRRKHGLHQRFLKLDSVLNMRQWPSRPVVHVVDDAMNARVASCVVENRKILVLA